MKEYLKDSVNGIICIIVLIGIILLYCSTPKEHKSRTVDEIIEQNRQIRADTTDTTIALIK